MAIVDLSCNMAGGSGATATAKYLDGGYSAASFGANSFGAASRVGLTIEQREIRAEMSGGSAMRARVLGGQPVEGVETTLGLFGNDSYGISPYSSILPSYGIESALALSPVQLRVRYTAMVDAGFESLLAPANYIIYPPVLIYSVVLESAQSVLVNTEPTTDAVYTVAVLEARGYFGQPLHAALASTQFTGAKVGPSFYAVATAKNRVRAVFSKPMLANAALTDPAQYVLKDFGGSRVPIASVTVEQPSDVRSTVLHLGTDLSDERHYSLTVSNKIVGQDSGQVFLSTSTFQWVENVLRTQIPLAEFSGEVMEGLYGIHGGLVFFSPALDVPASNSVIQVEQVDVCTRAYDEYQVPQPIDPSAFLTHGAGVVPTLRVSLLNSPDWALWAPFPGLLDARFEMALSKPFEEVMPQVADTGVITYTELWPPARVALLNALEWKLFKPDGVAASLTSAASGVVTVTGLSGMTKLDIGRTLTIQSAATAANNGNFLIVGFVSTTSVKIQSSAGVAPDANNGALVWTKPGAFITAANLTLFPSVVPTTTILDLTLAGGSSQTAKADLL